MLHWWQSDELQTNRSAPMQEHIVDGISDRLAQDLQASDGSLQGPRFILAFLSPPGLPRLTRLSRANPFGASLSPSLCHTLAPKAEERAELIPGL